MDTRFHKFFPSSPGGPPTPTPPLDFPYICNMTVKTALRRRGIGKQLLKACEDLVIKMDAKKTCISSLSNYRSSAIQHVQESWI
ncbi:hypothetical protein PVAP13_7NG281900 [Panicum virgatum]|uniref:N-acetyltransferase domain-containing protein n=1 Tax=Panicum virgatum TaxID=38727 RepID=A0A8T0PZB3_PANVG|nr:hypothetical protein PVAP13_7NG281900 [Panicum virgatum]